MCCMVTFALGVIVIMNRLNDLLRYAAVLISLGATTPIRAEPIEHDVEISKKVLARDVDQIQALTILAQPVLEKLVNGFPYHFRKGAEDTPDSYQSKGQRYVGGATVSLEFEIGRGCSGFGACDGFYANTLRYAVTSKNQAMQIEYTMFLSKGRRVDQTTVTLSDSDTDVPDSHTYLFRGVLPDQYIFSPDSKEVCAITFSDGGRLSESDTCKRIEKPVMRLQRILHPIISAFRQRMRYVSKSSKPAAMHYVQNLNGSTVLQAQK